MNSTKRLARSRLKPTRYLAGTITDAKDLLEVKRPMPVRLLLGITRRYLPSDKQSRWRDFAKLCGVSEREFTELTKRYPRVGHVLWRYMWIAKTGELPPL